jgi:hypothetical protein
VPGLFDMRDFFDDVLAGLPATSREFLTRSYYAEVSDDPDTRLRVRLRQNAVDRWRPAATLPGLAHVNSWIRAMPRAARCFKNLS